MLHSPLPPRQKFPGLMSRCTNPRRCSNLTASSIPLASCTVCKVLRVKHTDKGAWDSVCCTADLIESLPRQWAAGVRCHGVQVPAQQLQGQPAMLQPSRPVFHKPVAVCHRQGAAAGLRADPGSSSLEELCSPDLAVNIAASLGQLALLIRTDAAGFVWELGGILCCGDGGRPGGVVQHLVGLPLQQGRSVGRHRFACPGSPAHGPW